MGNKIKQILDFSCDWFREANDRGLKSLLSGIEFLGDYEEISKENFMRNVKSSIVEFLNKKNQKKTLNLFLSFIFTEPYFIFY